MRWLALVLLVGCVDARSGAGAECSRNSQCAAPLVCALERCRNECNSSRDCPVGAACVRSEDGFGVCELLDEVGGCDGGCEDGAVSACERDADCTFGVCVEARCEAECLSDRDCRFGTRCAEGRCTMGGTLDSGVPSDANVDAVENDAPTSDGGGFCPPSTISAVDVAVGRNHSCAVLADGSVYCWGANDNGQLGSATLVVGIPDSTSAFPADVSGAVEIVAGVATNCVRHADGTVTCWGDNSSGVCGVGRTDGLVPIPEATGLSGVDALTFGRTGACALTGSLVQCWGRQLSNGLANGEVSGNALAPVAATEIISARAIDYASGGGVAVDLGGRLFVWGDHHPGAETTPPYVDPPFTDTAGVALGSEHLCLLRPSGEVLCAGDNELGQLGDPSRDTSGGPDLAWAAVPGLSGVAQIDANENNTCARTDEGALWCWGANQNGSLGVGDSTTKPSPVRVEVPGSVDDFSVGTDTGCAIVDGAVYCWGRNGSGELGFPNTTGSTREPTVPVECLP